VNWKCGVESAEVSDLTLKVEYKSDDSGRTTALGRWRDKAGRVVWHTAVKMYGRPDRKGRRLVEVECEERLFSWLTGAETARTMEFPVPSPDRKGILTITVTSEGEGLN
jgi:hypothetical protein